MRRHAWGRMVWLLGAGITAVFAVLTASPAQASTTDFITTWQVTDSDKQISLPLQDIGQYDFWVDWGDASLDSHITTWNQAEVTHPYASAGTYTVTISFPDAGSKLKGWRFDNSAGAAEIRTIEQWGGKLNLGNSGHYFSGARNLTSTATDTPDLAGTTNFTFFFFGAAAFNGDISGWKTTGVTDMSFVFTGGAAFNRDLSGWDTSAVTNMNGMFDGALVFNQDIGGWDTAKVTNMNGMFYRAEAFTHDISAWQTAAVTDMAYMFNRAGLFNRDISGWNTAAVTDFTYMFYAAAAFDQDLSAWDVSGVTGATGMFDQSGMSTANYSNVLVGWSNRATLQTGVEFGADITAYSCGAADARESLIADHAWKITDAGEATGGCFESVWDTRRTSPGSSGDTQVRLPLEASGGYGFLVGWGDASSDIITSGTQAQATHTYAVAGTYTIRISGPLRGWRFTGDGDRLKIGNISSWGDVNFGNNGNYFEGAANLTASATDTPDLTGTTNFGDFFAGAAAFNGDVSSWVTSAVTSTFNMFTGAQSFNQDVSGWDTSAITDMSGMFAGATGFNQQLSAWDTGAVVDMSGMFSSAVAFNRSISGWDTAAVTDFDAMFSNAASFNQDLSPWRVGAVTSADAVFDGSGLSTPNYDKLLIGWSGQQVSPGVVFGAAGIMYSCAATEAHTTLTGVHMWTITDAGLAPCAVGPVSVNFGPTRVGSTAVQPVVLSNPGGQGLLVGQVTLTGPEFRIADDACSNATVPAAGTCTITIAFSPTSQGADKTADLRIPSNALTSPTAVALGGEGYVSKFTVSPSSLDLGQISVGSSSEAQLVRVYNNGGGTIVIDQVQVLGAGFTISETSCPNAALVSTRTCFVRVVFTPAVAGPAQGTLRFTSDDPGSPHDMALSGTGVAVPPPVTPKKQRLGVKLPKRIKGSGLTVITPANARTNAGQRVHTIVRGGPIQASTAGQIRYFTVVRGPKGKVSVRTYGRTDFRLRVTQKAPAVTGYTTFTRSAAYVRGVRR